MSLHIGMILFDGGGYPPDFRVDKESRALLRAGHKVSLLADRNPGQLPFEINDAGLRIHRIDRSSNTAVKRVLQSSFAMYPDVVSAIRTFLKQESIDVAHVHDVNYVNTVALVKPRSMPMVADLHENQPAAFEAYRKAMPLWKRGLDWIYHNPLYWRVAEQVSTMIADRVLVVVPEASTRFNRNPLVAPKIEIVSNTENLETYPDGLIDETVVNKLREEWIALYVGGIGPHRGLRETIEAASIIGPKYPNFKLHIVGIKTDKQRQMLQASIDQYHAQEYVVIKDRIPFEEVPSYLQGARTCLVPHSDFEHTQTTVPHKLFQYMIAGRHVLVSDCKPLARIIEDSNCGDVFKASDAHSMATVLERLLETPQAILDGLGQNGREAALSTYSWDRDIERLLAVYASLEQEVKQKTPIA